MADRKNRRGLGRPALGSSPLPASEALGSRYPPNGMPSSTFCFAADVAGGSVNPRQGLGAPVQLWRGVGAEGEPRCPRLDASGVGRASFFLRLGRPLLKWVSAEQNEDTEGGRTRCLRPRCSCALWDSDVVADRKNRRGLGRPVPGSSLLPASEALGRSYPLDGMPSRTVCLPADVGWRQRQPAASTGRSCAAVARCRSRGRAVVSKA